LHILPNKHCQINRSYSDTSAGFDPIPAPTDYKTKENPYANEWHIGPSIRYLQFWEIALHEYIGLLWASINQRG
jgi:hypothetical protein